MLYADFLTLAVDGLIEAAILFIVASGLTLIYAATRVVNLAQGGFYAIGAYGAALGTGAFAAGADPTAALTPYLALAILLAPPVIAAALVAVAAERGALRLLYRRDEPTKALGAFGLLLILEAMITLLFGGGSYAAVRSYDLLGGVVIGGLYYVLYDLLMIPLAAVIALSIGALLYRAGGVAGLRGLAQSAGGGGGAWRLTAVVALGCALAALGGALAAPRTPFTPGIGLETTLLALAVVLIGGLGSVTGALMGAVLVGMARVGGVAYAPGLELAVVFGAAALVLAVRPRGLCAPPAASEA